jgi:hypothetical protein
MTMNMRIPAAAALAASALVLAACGGSSDSGSSSEAPIGGGSAECTEQVMEQNAEGSAQAAGVELIDTKSYECADGWAIVFAITKSGDIEQTTAFVYQAEGPTWAQKQLDGLCSDNADGAPQSIIDQACALR